MVNTYCCCFSAQSCVFVICVILVSRHFFVQIVRSTGYAASSNAGGWTHYTCYYWRRWGFASGWKGTCYSRAYLGWWGYSLLLWKPAWSSVRIASTSLYPFVVGSNDNGLMNFVLLFLELFSGQADIQDLCMIRAILFVMSSSLWNWKMWPVRSSPLFYLESLNQRGQPNLHKRL